jgi:hypothetical protein
MAFDMSLERLVAQQNVFRLELRQKELAPDLTDQQQHEIAWQIFIPVHYCSSTTMD